MTTQTQETQKQTLDRLFQSWEDAPWLESEKAFDPIEKYLDANNLTLAQAVKIRNPELDINAILAVDLQKFLRD